MTTNEPIIRSFGKIERVVADSLAYASLDDRNKTLSFVPSVVEGYRGQTLEELQVSEGATVSLDWQLSSGIVTRASLVSHTTSKAPPSNVRSGFLIRDPFRTRSPAEGQAGKRRSSERAQIELHPERKIKGCTAPLRALPAATRKFGRLVDASNLAPADLLLSRELEPDRISSLITSVQQDGGYHFDDARWTHAAMYVGDGASVVEATFDTVLGGGSVRLTNLDEYSQGMHSLRFRRPKCVVDDRLGWRICVRAMSRLGKPYDFVQAVLMWFGVAFRGQGFFGNEIRGSTSAAVICSTLYADSYNEATRRSLGEISGVCVPAWLSVSDEFNDIQAEWLEISD